MSHDDNEIAVIETVYTALEPLDATARNRVLTYVASRLSVDVHRTVNPAVDNSRERTEAPEAGETSGQPSAFSGFAELFEAADPQSNGEKALIAGYWLQVCQGGEGFTGASAQKELKNLGHQLANITRAIDVFKDRKPALILQVRKSGTAGQARKLYKVSHEGIKRVEEMLSG